MELKPMIFLKNTIIELHVHSIIRKKKLFMVALRLMQMRIFYKNPIIKLLSTLYYSAEKTFYGSFGKSY